MNGLCHSKLFCATVFMLGCGVLVAFAVVLCLIRIGLDYKIKKKTMNVNLLIIFL